MTLTAKMMKMLDNADNAQCITNNDKESKCQAIFFLHFDILLLFVFFPVQKINFPMPGNKTAVSLRK